MTANNKQINNFSVKYWNGLVTKNLLTELGQFKALNILPVSLETTGVGNL